MSSKHPSDDALSTGLDFWAMLWQQQFEQNLKIWAIWAQALPHPTAHDLAIEADAMKGSSQSRKKAA